jgi:hypothetical protein
MKLLTDIVRSFFCIGPNLAAPEKKTPEKRASVRNRQKLFWIFSGFSCIFRRNNGCEGNSAAVLAEL